MLKTLWFLIKIALIVGIIVWIAEHPGKIAIDWMEYTFTLHLGVFAAALFALIFTAIAVYRLLNGLKKIPKSIKTHGEKRAVAKSYNALTRGLTAVAAGDTKTARKCAKAAQRLLNDNTKSDTHALALLLSAQTAQLEGKQDEAKTYFTKLSLHKDGAFLGIRGLLRAALDNHDLDEAKRLIENAIKAHPKQPWILKTAFEIDLRLKDWVSALDQYTRLIKIKNHVNDNEIRNPEADIAALHTAQGKEFQTQNNRKEATTQFEKALKSDPAFIPAASALAENYIEAGKSKKAIKVIEKTWKTNPHPELGALWTDLMPEKKKAKASSRMGWYEHLVILNPDSIESHLIAAKAAMAESLWGEARSYLERALTLKPDSRVYDALIALEDNGTHDLGATAKWQDALLDAPPAPMWICRTTGRIFDRWYPLVETGSEFTLFNTIAWLSPDDAYDARIENNSTPRLITQNI